MKELIKEYPVNLDEIYYNVPKQTNRFYSGSDKELNFIFSDKEYVKKFEKNLDTEDKRNYVKALINKASKLYKNAGEFRTAISREDIRLNKSDPDYLIDTNILIRIFSGSNFPVFGSKIKI